MAAHARPAAKSLLDDRLEIRNITRLCGKYLPIMERLQRDVTVGRKKKFVAEIKSEVDGDDDDRNTADDKPITYLFKIVTALLFKNHPMDTDISRLKKLYYFVSDIDGLHMLDDVARTECKIFSKVSSAVINDIIEWGDEGYDNGGDYVDDADFVIKFNDMAGVIIQEIKSALPELQQNEHIWNVENLEHNVFLAERDKSVYQKSLDAAKKAFEEASAKVAAYEEAKEPVPEGVLEERSSRHLDVQNKSNHLRSAEKTARWRAEELEVARRLVGAKGAAEDRGGRNRRRSTRKSRSRRKGRKSRRRRSTRKSRRR